jgi:thiamine biosynthesis protein ThiI
MFYDHILVKYGEIALKGKNRSHFENELKQRIKEKLKGFPDLIIKKGFDRTYILLNGQAYEPIIEQLQEVFGIQILTVAVKCTTDIETVQKTALASLLEAKPKAKTFKVTGKRANKTYPINSMELNHLVGGYILENTDNLKVDVHHPEVNVRVEIKDNSAYISCLHFPGAGGLPVGSSGKVMVMLSGGIDSPVAAYLTLKRGARIEMIHFHSPPFTSERAKQKVEDLTKQLTQYGGKIVMHIVPFTNVQQEIKNRIPENYSMTVMRRFMLRIAEQIAEKNNALALVTGESLGQVASQTLHSMNTINEVTNIPIIRPVITMDKIEIMDIANRIKTYDISIRPFEDCCTVFLPPAPKTRPNREKVNRFELNIAIDELVRDAVEKSETIEFKPEHHLEEEFGDLF